MVRHLLIAAVSMAASAIQPAAGPALGSDPEVARLPLPLRTPAATAAAHGHSSVGGPGARVASDSIILPHGKMTCAACHRGPPADREIGSVPTRACTTSGCHGEGGPDTVRVSTVTFAHRDHGSGARVPIGCAACHTHDGRGTPVGASLEACGLCHADALAGRPPGKCLSCHQQPAHVPTTNQGVPVPHGSLPGVRTSLPWVENGCTRCHYDVGEPDLAVSIRRCRACHEDLEAVTSRGIGTDLHVGHTGVNCTACHQQGSHRVRAMSSVVWLRCGECHRGVHGTTLGAGTGDRDVSAEARARPVCVDCHRAAHAAEQRLTLGVVPGVEVQPAFKFMAGLTCASCHLPAGSESRGRPGVPAARSLRPCASCHPPEYDRVLRWWVDGTREREEGARAYLATAESRLSSVGDSVAALLAGARELLTMVRAGGALHNLRVSDEAYRAVVSRSEAAYELAGRSAPSTPDMGRRPRPGFCSYCHYPVDQPRRLGRMPLDFHREVFGEGAERDSTAAGERP